MKIENKIIFSNIVNIGLILVIGFFAMQNLNIMLTKLRFIEVADDLNASFLEMRLSEKNYFLYHDASALRDIKEEIEATFSTINLASKDISRAVGEQNFETLNIYLKRYEDVLDEIRKKSHDDTVLEVKFRTEGRKLREFSSTMTRLERNAVNKIISRSKDVLFFSFWAVLFSAVLVSHFVSQKILRSLRAIERLARSISQGNFNNIEGAVPGDEFGSVMTAINSMSEELAHREEALIQSKKLASLGILTAGVAHELRNPLNNISMIAQNYMELYDSLGEGSRLDLMRQIDDETKRIEGIVDNLLDFSKPKEANLKKADINAVIRKTLSLVQNMIDISNIETRLNLVGSIPYGFIDEHQIQQVLVNFITNAVQAMQAGGTLYISTRAGNNADSIEITVMDTGKGIPPEFLPHIFDPFFSTKGEGGAGLGLSVSYGIIKNHKGTIRAESKVGVGTTFTIELPAYREENNGPVQDYGD